MGRLDECYAIYGTGGWEVCNVIQDKLQTYGLCSYFRWEPDPPDWRFFFETHLKPKETLDLLGNYAARYNVRLK
jgi:hypothetical protein